MELHGKDQLQGKVVDVSDAGSQEEAFAVVEIEGLSQPVVVPMKHIKGIRLANKIFHLAYVAVRCQAIRSAAVRPENPCRL
jgi:hypothetical protein